jgi:hypothetical protein
MIDPAYSLERECHRCVPSLKPGISSETCATSSPDSDGSNFSASRKLRAAPEWLSGFAAMLRPPPHHLISTGRTQGQRVCRFPNRRRGRLARLHRCNQLGKRIPVNQLDGLSAGKGASIWGIGATAHEDAGIRLLGGHDTEQLANERYPDLGVLPSLALHDRLLAVLVQQEVNPAIRCDATAFLDLIALATEGFFPPTARTPASASP